MPSHAPANGFEAAANMPSKRVAVTPRAPDAGAAAKTTMRGVQRVVAVFESFTPQRPALALHEIAGSIGLAKSTTFRIVQSLEQCGYVIRLEDQKYCLSFRFTRLAGMVMSTLSIRQIARPLLVELARRTNETITLNVASERERVCIDVIDTPSPLMSMARQGQYVTFNGRGATGKTLMAHFPSKELERLLGPVAKATARKREDIAGELSKIRKDGYCVSHGERVLGLSAIAAPVWDASDTAKYCVTITAPTVRLKPRIHELVPLLLQTSRDISRRMGANGSPTAIAAVEPKAKDTAMDVRVPRQRHVANHR